MIGMDLPRVASRVWELVSGGFDFIFRELPKRSFFPLVLLGGALILVVLYLIFWYTQLYSR